MAKTKATYLTKDMRNKIAMKNHMKWLKSIGVKLDSNGKVINEFKGFPFPDYSVRPSIPCSNIITAGATKRKVLKPQLPAGKTISIAYNKGNYQVVDIADIKTMGRKV
jgi:hypothetical protein|tara:strand:+ start:345 stop:668 length:324 start_codon:yes stop_codon:yes gene_type:complete